MSALHHWLKGHTFWLILTAVFHFQVMSWISMRTILWSWPFPSSLITRYLIVTFKNFYSEIAATFFFKTLSLSSFLFLVAIICFCTERVGAFYCSYWKICGEPKEFERRVMTLCFHQNGYHIFMKFNFFSPAEAVPRRNQGQIMRIQRSWTLGKILRRNIWTMKPR